VEYSSSGIRSIKRFYFDTIKWYQIHDLVQSKRKMATKGQKRVQREVYQQVSKENMDKELKDIEEELDRLMLKMQHEA
jgi:hypothetical protein